jgi:hypothetical protein
MKEYKNDSFNFIDKHFFTRPKIGFLISLAIILWWSFYSHINTTKLCFPMLHWWEYLYKFWRLSEVPNNLWLASIYKGLFMEGNLIFATPLIIFSFTFGRLIEKLKVIKGFDTLILKLSYKIEKYFDKLIFWISINENLKFTLSQNLMNCIKLHKSELEKMFYQPDWDHETDFRITFYMIDEKVYFSRGHWIEESKLIAKKTSERATEVIDFLRGEDWKFAAYIIENFADSFYGVYIIEKLDIHTLVNRWYFNNVDISNARKIIKIEISYNIAILYEIIRTITKEKFATLLDL